MALAAIQTSFTRLDWGVVIGYLLLTTWVGHALSGKNATIRDFFLGGKSLPWWAVSGSIVATEISALTFIAVPGGVFAAQGDWSYLQWGLGSIIARFAVGYWLVPVYFRQEIFSPYDYMGSRLGEGIRRLVTGLFSVGAILGQSVRVLVTAIILSTVTPLSITMCIVLISAFAVLWTLLGGMRTVIWTDVIQFCIFIFGGLLAFGWLIGHIGWDTVWEINRHAGAAGDLDKTRWLDFSAPWQKSVLEHTFWVGVIAMPFQNFAAFGVDQLNAQRIFCCGSARDARLAVIWSSVSLFTTLLMLSVGSGLFAWYQIHGLTPEEAAKFAEDTNFVFPVWITTVLPPGITGLILAGAFAAAISSLDSVLAALSQTTLSAFYGRERMEEVANSRQMVIRSRWMVCFWGLALALAAVLLAVIYARGGDRNLINLAFGMVAYTYGPLLGILLAALLPGRRWMPGIYIGTLVSFLLVAWNRPELANLLDMLGENWTANWAHSAAEWLRLHAPTFQYTWFYPINTFITLGFALLPFGHSTLRRQPGS